MQRCANGRRLLASSVGGRSTLLSSNSSSSCSTTTPSVLAETPISMRRSTDILRASAGSLVMPLPGLPAPEREESSPQGTLLSVIEQSAHAVAASRPSITMPAPALPPPRRDSFVADSADVAVHDAALVPRHASAPLAPASSMRPLLRRASVCASSVPEFVLQLDEQRRNSITSPMPSPVSHFAQADSRDSSPLKRKASIEVPSPPSKRSSEPSLLRQVLSLPSLHTPHQRASVAIQNPSSYKRLPPVLGGHPDNVHFSLSNAKRISESEPIDFHSWQPAPALPTEEQLARTSFS